MKCSKCEIDRPTDRFYIRKGGQSEYRMPCKDCINDRQDTVRALKREKEAQDKENHNLSLETLKCTKCDTERCIDRFSLYKSGKPELGYRMPCKDCVNEKNRNSESHKEYIKNKTAQYRAEKRPKFLLNNLISQLKPMSITVIQYWTMLDEQNWVCSICGEECAKGRLCIDHDHNCCSGNFSCGKCIRGLLCRSCNGGLGGFDDNPELLQIASKYVLDRSIPMTVYECTDTDCAAYGYTVRTSAKWLAIGAPKCPMGHDMY